MDFDTGYNFDSDVISSRTGVSDFGPSLAKQEFKDECDINVIVRRFGLGIKLPESFRVPQYGDFTSVDDFQSAVQIIQDAEAQFMKIPAATRALFDNDPTKFVMFSSDPANMPELVKLGLAQERPSSPSPASPVPSPGPDTPLPADPPAGPIPKD